MMRFIRMRGSVLVRDYSKFWCREFQNTFGMAWEVIRLCLLHGGETLFDCERSPMSFWSERPCMQVNLLRDASLVACSNFCPRRAEERLTSSPAWHDVQGRVCFGGCGALGCVGVVSVCLFVLCACCVRRRVVRPCVCARARVLFMLCTCAPTLLVLTLRAWARMMHVDVAFRSLQRSLPHVFHIGSCDSFRMLCNLVDTKSSFVVAQVSWPNYRLIGCSV